MNLFGLKFAQREQVKFRQTMKYCYFLCVFSARFFPSIQSNWLKMDVCYLFSVKLFNLYNSLCVLPNVMWNIYFCLCLCLSFYSCVCVYVCESVLSLLCVWIYNLAITSGCCCFAFEFSSSSPNHFQNTLYVILAFCVCIRFLCVFLNVSLANANSRCKWFVDV